MNAQVVARTATFGVWAALAASLVFWGLRLFASTTPVPPQAVTPPTSQALRGDLTRLFGAAPGAEDAEPVVVAAASRFKLIGVVAPRSPQAASQGLALIAVDGKPARAYRGGASIDGDLVLQRVRARGADLGARGGAAASVALDIAPLLAAATGTLPAAGAAPLAGGVRAGPALLARPGTPLARQDNQDLAGEADDGDAEPTQPSPAHQPGMRNQGVQTQ
jgi:general secretion pathway protein C